MSSIKLSIIIPVYGVELLINDFLDSIFSQLNESVECIFINDGTFDNSINILKKYISNYSNKNNIIILNQENQGVSAARNTGLKIANGNFVTFLDPDDCVSDNYINSLSDIIEKYGSTVDIIHFNADVITIDGSKKKLKYVDNTGYYKINEEALVKIFEKNSWQPWLRVLKKDLLVGFEFPVGYILEDLIAFPFLYNININIFELSEELVIYKLNSYSLTSKVTPIFLKSISHAIEFYREYRDIEWYRKIYVHLLQIMYNVKIKQGRKDFFKFCDFYGSDLNYIKHEFSESSFKIKLKYFFPKIYYFYKTKLGLKKLKVAK